MAERARKAAAPGGLPRCRALLQVLARLLALPAALALAPPAATQDKDGPKPADFANVTTIAAARKLVREGRLVEISLFPTELGGPEEPDNMSFTTPEAAAAREEVVDMLDDQLDRGLIDQMVVSPVFEGDSLVPSSITIAARHSERDGGIEVTIEVW